MNWNCPNKIVLVAVLLIGLQSCNTEVTPCDCADIGLEMYRKMDATNFDPQQMEEIEKEFEGKLKKCEEKVETLSEAESDKFEREMQECHSYKQIMIEANRTK